MREGVLDSKTKVTVENIDKAFNVKNRVLKGDKTIYAEVVGSSFHQVVANFVEYTEDELKILCANGLLECLGKEDALQQTPICLAVVNASFPAVIFLTEDVKIYSPNMRSADLIKPRYRAHDQASGQPNAKTILHVAASYPLNGSILKHLLSYSDVKALIDAEDLKKETALHRAVRTGSLGNVKALLKARANPNVQSNSDETPLHIAVKRQVNSSIIELLLKKNADIYAKDNKNQTPLSLAEALKIKCQTKVQKKALENKTTSISTTITDTKANLEFLRRFSIFDMGKHAEHQVILPEIEALHNAERIFNLLDARSNPIEVQNAEHASLPHSINDQKNSIHKKALELQENQHELEKRFRKLPANEAGCEILYNRYRRVQDKRNQEDRGFSIAELKKDEDAVVTLIATYRTSAKSIHDRFFECKTQLDALSPTYTYRTSISDSTESDSTKYREKILAWLDPNTILEESEIQMLKNIFGDKAYTSFRSDPSQVDSEKSRLAKEQENLEQSEIALNKLIAFYNAVLKQILDIQRILKDYANAHTAIKSSEEISFAAVAHYMAFHLPQPNIASASSSASTSLDLSPRVPPSPKSDPGPATTTTSSLPEQQPYRRRSTGSG